MSETASIPDRETLLQRLEPRGQQHLLRWWDELDAPARARLAEEILAVDFDKLAQLVDELVRGEAPPVDPASIGPVEVHRMPETDGERAARRAAADVGVQALRAGEVAVVLVAGGQGTRLGFDGPKGTYPIGPVSAASLFQIHAEKIVALGRKHGRDIPLYVMTSPDNHEATVEFFARRDDFGLPRLRFFTQGSMPAVDRETGRVLLAEKHRLALSPDGHGGTLRALARPAPDGGPSCLDEMTADGIRTIFYFQVDNPLVKIADPAFLGLHRLNDAEISFKVVEKVLPAEKLGVVVTLDGKPAVIEYSDLPAELAERRAPGGGLELWAGSIAVHLFELEFVNRLVAGGGLLPFHRAVKKVPHIDDAGRLVEPEQPNAVKFETFIFDALPLARRSLFMETLRNVEFEPLKNANGSDSPATVRQRMSDLFADWLEAAGARVERRPDGSVPFGVEISPLYALEPADLRDRVPEGAVVAAPLYLGPESAKPRSDES